MNFFITGKPGIGKTTLAKKIIKKTKLIWGGFYTQEIRKNRNRVGFEIVGLNGCMGILAHIDYHSQYKVGKYSVNLHDLESIAVTAIEQALLDKKPILIDEIGKMELVSERFKDFVKKALSEPQPVLATITMANLSFVNQIKRRTDVIVAELINENRNLLEKMIFDFLEKEGLINV